MEKQGSDPYMPQGYRVAGAVSALRERGQTQDRASAPYGNCLEAALATVLGVPLGQVPDLRTAAEKRGVNGRRLDALMRYRKSALRRWIAEHFGLLWIESPGVPDLGGEDWNAEPLVWLASGMSPRGLRHVVVYVDDVMAWDPHPSRDGLLDIDAWGVFVPLGQDTVPRSRLSAPQGGSR